MKLLFDITPTQWIANGSGIYTTMIFEKAIEMGYTFDCLYSKKIDIPGNIRGIAEKNQCKLIQYNTKADIEDIINKNKYDKLYFGTLLNSDCKIPAQVEVIVTLHDIRFIEVPNDKFRYLYRKTFFERFKQRTASLVFPSLNVKEQVKAVSKIINHSKLKIVTVSNHSKFSILQFFPSISNESISVLYCPYPDLIINKEKILDSSFLKELKVISKEYFLIISANRWFKNAYRALIALDELISNHKLNNKKVVVAGHPGSAIVRSLKNIESFVFIDYLPDAKLQLLYENAFCFIYPSLQEGFGIPPLEAMTHGTPVLASAVASITEICGDGVLYFNPYSISEIKNRIMNIIMDDNYRQELIQKSEKHLNRLHIKQQADLKKLIDLIFNSQQITEQATG